MTPIIIIPAHLASKRLPDKVLLPIGDKMLLEHVWYRATLAACAPVFIASGDKKISMAMQKIGANIIETDPQCNSGSDRVLQALEKKDPEEKFDTVINLQGDMPFIPPSLLRDGLETLKNHPDADIVTPICAIPASENADNTDIVKVAASFKEGAVSGRALYFSRNKIPHGSESQIFKHIGLYIYRRDALKKFGKNAITTLERCERLEQLRALEMGMTLYAWKSAHFPLSVDNPKDLEQARAVLR